MAVDIKTASSTFEVGAPKALFQTRLPGYPGPKNDYDVSADGQRFLINNLAEEATSTPISVVINCTSDLKH